MNSRLKILLLYVVMCPKLASSQNPFIKKMYSADPSARVFNDTLYVYPSHDTDTAKWFNMEDWHVFSTTNMKDWKDHGVAFGLKDISWAKRYAWAPDCVFKNGKYYFYYPTDQDFIGVAEGDKPYGPFKDPLGKPLISRASPGVIAPRDLIDPAAFIDDDGSAYLYFGQNVVNMVKLNEDMISYNGKVNILKGADNFFEALWMHKYNSKYYLSYCGKDPKTGKNQIMYATGNSPLGPFQYQGVILKDMNSETNHHSIVQYKGGWYLFYHNADLFFSTLSPEDAKADLEKNWKGIHPFRRSICVDKLKYRKDGSIVQVKPTLKGVKKIK
jgi:beta-xylosidase